jgi:thymidylate synthase (FAD)
VEFKFRVRAPVVTWWQWVRHRTFNMNAQSGRYTEFEENDFYVPDVWRRQSPSNKQASLGQVSDEDGQALTAALLEHYARSYALYEDAIAKGVARELARAFLPGFSVYYTWVVKVDAHNMMHFLKLRMAEEAQHEIRVYAEAIYRDFFKPLLPWTAEAFEKYVLGKEE